MVSPHQAWACLFSTCELPCSMPHQRHQTVHGECERSPKLPITCDVLACILTSATHPILAAGLISSHHDHSIPQDSLDVESSHAFRQEFRPEHPPHEEQREFVPALCPSHVFLTVPASKTDPFRRVSQSQLQCPWSAYMRLVALKNLFDTSSGPQSCSIHTGRGAPFQETPHRPLRSSLTRAGFDVSKFSGHSFRRSVASSGRGVVSLAAAVGFNDYEIQLLGTMRSDSYSLYIG